MKESELLYIRYRIPFPREVNASVTRYDGGGFGDSSLEARGLLRRVAKELDGGALGITTSQQFSRSFLEYLRSKGADLERDGWRLFVAAMADPAQAFGDLLLGEGDISYYPHISSDFVDLVDDVIRDGRVTKAEIEFLREKSLVYGVSESDLEQILKTKGRFHHPLLKLVNEICSDGTVTPAERCLLADKAREFGGIADVEIERLLRRGLSLRRHAQGPSTDPIFSHLVGGLFLARYILHSLTLSERFLSAADDYLSGTTPAAIEQDRLQGLSHSLGAELNAALSYPSFDPNVSLFEILDTVARIPEAEAQRGPVVASSNRATNDLIWEGLAHGLRFQVRAVNSARLPLFSHEVAGSIVTVFLNMAHPFLVDSGKGAIELSAKLALAMTLTRIELFGDDEVVEEFLDRLSANERLIARKFGGTHKRNRSDELGAGRWS
jgi:hypothetical protein